MGFEDPLRPSSADAGGRDGPRPRLVGCAILALACTFSMAARASESGEGQVFPPGGLGLSLMLAATECVANGDATCRGSGPHVGVGATVLYRHGPFAGMSGSFFYGKLDQDLGDLECLGALLGGRMYAPMEMVDIYGEFGLGWGRYRQSVPHFTTTMSGVLIAFGVGVEVRPLPYLAIGATVRYHLPVFNQLCERGPGYRECTNPAAGIDAVAHLLAGLTVTAFLPLGQP